MNKSKSVSKSNKKFAGIDKDVHYYSIIQSLIENEWQICNELSTYMENMRKVHIKFHKMVVKNTMSVFKPTIDDEGIKLENYNLKFQDKLIKHEDYLNHLDLRVFIKLDGITKRLGITDNRSSKQISDLRRIMDKDN